MRAQLDWILKNLSDPTQYIKETRVAIADTAPAPLLRLQVEFNRKSKLSYWAPDNLIFPCTSVLCVGVFLKYQLLMQLLKFFLAGFIGITRIYTDLLGYPNIAFNTESCFLLNKFSTWWVQNYSPYENWESTVTEWRLPVKGQGTSNNFYLIKLKQWQLPKIYINVFSFVFNSIFSNALWIVNEI